eukprot:5310767-Prorocentrum_lima.AAC.1
MIGYALTLGWDVMTSLYRADDEWVVVASFLQLLADEAFVVTPTAGQMELALNLGHALTTPET